jgi:hypothetical protein
MLLNEGSAKIQYRQFLNISSEEYKDVLRNNVQDNALTLTALISNLDL